MNTCASVAGVRCCCDDGDGDGDADGMSSGEVGAAGRDIGV